jgi:Gpi18-like mannosyltransferase
MGRFIHVLMSPKWKSRFRVMPAGEVTVLTASDRSGPSLWEVLLMVATVFAVHLLTVCRVRTFWDVAASWLDNPDYLDVVTIIRNWHFSGTEMPRHFWGFPYAIAGISKVFSVPELMALVIVSVLASVATCVLVHRLYGGWVAAAFIFINYEWIILSVEGGSEPLFMCLLYASFLAARSSRWNLAALLASLSTTVRPVGVFALLAFAAVLARRRSYRQLAVITLIGLAIGVLYIVPLWIILGSPFANFIGYRGAWGPRGWPLTYPFGTLFFSYLAAVHHIRWKVLVYSAVWPVFALVGTVAMWLPRNSQRFSMDQPEPLFASIYTLFLVSYDYRDIPLHIHRLVIPVVPVLLFSLRDWIPRDRRVLWVAAAISALLSCAPLLYFWNVFGFRLP